jgi:adenylylsulfate kinase
MGLPGSGKTTLAKKIFSELSTDTDNVFWYNADVIRHYHNDWDFSPEGRLRQAKRLRDICAEHPDAINVVDFVAPTQEIRNIFGADFMIWMNTIVEGRYKDTNKVFENPINHDVEISNVYDVQLSNLIKLIKNRHTISF